MRVPDRRLFTHRVQLQIISQITGQAASEKMAIVVAGVAKLYVGELVEAGKKAHSHVFITSNECAARDVLLEEHSRLTGEVDPRIEAPIRPDHLREAFRRIRASQSLQLQSLPAQRYRPRSFV